MNNIPEPIKVSNVNDLPKLRVDYWVTEPLRSVIDSYFKRFGVMPNKIYHFCSTLGNWQFLSIEVPNVSTNILSDTSNQ